jgi:signal peptidase II
MIANTALFQAISVGTPAALGSLAWFFSLTGSYWTAPLILLGLWWWSNSATDPARARAGRLQFAGFGMAFMLAILAAIIMKLWLDFTRPPVILGDLVRVLGEIEQHYSLPSGHATYSALVVGALWPLVGRYGRIGLILYVGLVGWSRIATGRHFPVEVLAGWGLGWGCTALARWLISLAVPAWHTACSISAFVWYGVAACIIMVDQLAKLAINHTLAHGEQVEVTPFFNLVYVLNSGAAFSVLANASGWQRYFFIAIGLAISAWLVRILRQHLPRLEALGYSLTLGGALGNITDRVFRGQVVDFLDFYWLHTHFPAFNLADVAIALGAALLIAEAQNKSAIEGAKSSTT